MVPLASTTRKNVLYMMADDMRPEWNAYCPSCNVITPNLDKLVSTGLLFTRAYCQQSICGPSRNSYMSGRRPDTTLTFNFRDNFRTSPMRGGGTSRTALPEYFKNAGYDTRGSGKTYHGNSPPNHDMPRSWDSYVPAKYPPAYGDGYVCVFCML